jgi:hypothetical protein
VCDEEPIMSRQNAELWLTAAECAERTGLTVRALRVYEEYGLIAPQRTLSGWRPVAGANPHGDAIE